MLKNKLIKKLLISVSAIFALLLIYFLPNKEEDLVINQKLEYENQEVITSTIFLLDNYNYLGKTKVVTSSTEIENKVKELVNVLIKDGEGENKIPSGFVSILPSDTRILSILYKDGLVKINFSKELLDIVASLEEKMIEAIVYTITSINEVEKVIIYVEGDILSKLPQTGITLPSTLDKNWGINKTSNFTKINDITQVTVYYLNRYNDNYYYVPVTKYLNDNRDKIKIIIEELASSSTYTPNLLSYLNNNAELLTVKKENDIMELTFNSYIFSDINNKNILEEVIYSICLSIQDNYEVKEVIFNAEDYNLKTVLNEIK